MPATCEITPHQEALDILLAIARSYETNPHQARLAAVEILKHTPQPSASPPPPETPPPPQRERNRPSKTEELRLAAGKQINDALRRRYPHLDDGKPFFTSTPNVDDDTFTARMRPP